MRNYTTQRDGFEFFWAAPINYSYGICRSTFVARMFYASQANSTTVCKFVATTLWNPDRAHTLMPTIRQFVCFFFCLCSGATLRRFRWLCLFMRCSVARKVNPIVRPNTRAAFISSIYSECAHSAHVRRKYSTKLFVLMGGVGAGLIMECGKVALYYS